MNRFSSLSDEDLLKLDSVCARFEKDLRNRQSASIEQGLAQVSGPLQKILFTELLASEIEFLHARGQLPDLHDYLRRFPDHASEAGVIYRDSIQRGAARTVSSSRELSGRPESGGAPTGATRQVGGENTPAPEPERTSLPRQSEKETGPAAVSCRPLHPEANTHDDTFIFSFKRRAKTDSRQKPDGGQT